MSEVSKLSSTQPKAVIVICDHYKHRMWFCIDSVKKLSTIKISVIMCLNVIGSTDRMCDCVVPVVTGNHYFIFLLKTYINLRHTKISAISNNNK